MRRLPIYILIANSNELNEQSIDSIRIWIQNEISKFLKNPFTLEFFEICIISFNHEINLHVPLTNIIDFEFPKINIYNSSELNFKETISYLNKKIEGNNKDIGIVYWIVNEIVFNKLLETNIREALLKLKSIGSIVLQINDLMNFSFSDFCQWHASSFVGDTFHNFIEDMYKKNLNNIIAV